MVIVSFIVLFVIFLPLEIMGQPSEQNVYVIPITGEINPAVYQYVADSLRTVENDKNAAAVIFEIDTYGGRIDSAERISNLILKAGIPTISFVNTKAESAGVLLAISADTIVMAPASTIGSAETIPNTEKVLSLWTSLLRSVAEEKGRDPELVASMADKSIEIPEVVEKDRLLNLTAQEAKELEFADLIERDYEGILEGLSIVYTDIIQGQIDPKVRMAQFLTSAYLTPILLTLGFVGLVIEILTPGFGIGGTVSFLAFALFFGGGILAGNVGWAVLILFLAGLTLLIIEAFAPGFGVPGIGGIICIIISIVMASTTTAGAIVSLLISLVLSVIALVLILKYAPRSKHFDRIILSTELIKESGYSSTEKNDHLIGQEGMVLTYLRPSGTIQVNGDILDVVSEGAFIEAGSKVKISKVEGRRIVVKKID
jgi:membrane-bound serine protease (ClpP class)